MQDPPPAEHPAFSTYLARLLMHAYQNRGHPGTPPEGYVEWALQNGHPRSMADLPAPTPAPAPAQDIAGPPSSDITDWLSAFNQPQRTQNAAVAAPTAAIPVGGSAGHSTYGEFPAANPMAQARQYNQGQAASPGGLSVWEVLGSQAATLALFRQSNGGYRGRGRPRNSYRRRYNDHPRDDEGQSGSRSNTRGKPFDIAPFEPTILATLDWLTGNNSARRRSASPHRNDNTAPTMRGLSSANATAGSSGSRRENEGERDDVSMVQEKDI
ncbi:hypothetical protein M422DRAFT_51004 [Sphaerobolus stellatus SS14]|uniref:Unplaced genomic scaffold SPHSTscaffold_102, whole genome shotgun sequence n=1 Tax=Sphaerobolus stellatus (strain SS14) TaxID=990650 RepID=A0A0C9UNW6_SPHS4|nr:hypothetical protein M422DRAFT_51004 [Sphaerobolus stellatus SS14]